MVFPKQYFFSEKSIAKQSFLFHKKVKHNDYSNTNIINIYYINFKGL